MPATKSLRDAQLVDLTFAMARERSANLSDPGCGKTPPTCVFFYWLWKEHKERVMWAMPKSLLRKNLKEILLFTDFEPGDVVIYDGTPEQRAKIRKNSDAKVWLMGFRRYSDDWHTLWNLHNDFNCLAVDEVHLGFGGETSEQTLQMHAGLRYMKRYLPLTGTLINGRLDSAYNVIKAINPGYYSSHEHFMAEHAIKDLDGRTVAWRNHEKLAKIFKEVAIRRDFTSTYGKNVIVPIIREVEMAEKQKEIYTQWEGEALLELDDRFLEAANGGVAAIRAAQILSHPESVHLPVEFDKDTGKPTAYREYNLTGKERTGKDEQLLIDLADHKNTGEPLIIFGVFEKTLERIAELCRKQGFRVGVIHGGVPGKRRETIDEQFQAGEIDVVVGSYQTCGIGFNWGHVDHIICYELDYGDSAFIQARRRAERGTREKPLRLSIYIYEGAKVENRKMEVIERKSADANKVDDTNELIVFRPKDDAKKKAGASTPAPRPKKIAPQAGPPGPWNFM
jgi:SNF2 family DNA or RNA helicase